MGSDSLLHIHKWKEYEKLLNICKFIVAKRPGHDNSMLDKVTEDLNSRHNSSIFILESSLIDISSSEIRERIKKGASINYLVPKSVEIYIHKNKLYR